MTRESTNGFMAGAAERGSEAVTTASAVDVGTAAGRTRETVLLFVAGCCARIRPGALVAG
ncbi:MAG: hypothetical protein C0483_13280 [Pirellula sp.]|nr:hypothetical protein [Pirellula sp.]